MSDLEDSRSIISDIQGGTSFTLNNYKNESLSDFYTNKYRKSNFGFELLPEQKNMAQMSSTDNFGGMLNSVKHTEDLLAELSINEGKANKPTMTTASNNHGHRRYGDKMDQPIGGITRKDNDLFLGNNFLTDLMVQGPNIGENL